VRETVSTNDKLGLCNGQNVRLYLDCGKLAGYRGLPLFKA